MKLLKKVLIVLGILVIIPFIVALFVPMKYTVSVSETINKPYIAVYDYVKILKNQEYYSEWVKADPNLHPTITGQDGTVGAKQSWNSQNPDIGSGEQIITNMTVNCISVDLKFFKPYQGEAKAATILKSITPTRTLITSEFYANETYPFNLMSYFIGRPMIKETEIKNLKNLKEILEKNPVE